MTEQATGSHQPTGARKTGIALQVTMWLAALCLVAGLAYALVGPEPDPRPTVEKAGRLFPDVQLADVSKIRVFDPDGGYEFSRTSPTGPWIVKTLRWSKEATYDSALRLDTVPCALDEDLFNAFMEGLLKSESRKVHETDISRALIDKTIPDGPRFVLTDKDGRELGHVVVGAGSRQTGGTFLIVFPPDGGDGALHEVAMLHRPDFEVDQYIRRTDAAEADPAMVPSRPQSPTLHDPGWTREDSEIARVQDSGLRIAIRKAGQGREVKETDSLVMHYTAWLEDGTVFNATRGPGFEKRKAFRLASPWHGIEGWQKGLLGMQVGEVRKLWIPPELAYGDSGYPPKVPPMAAMIFEIELLEIKNQGS